MTCFAKSPLGTNCINRMMLIACSKSGADPQGPGSIYFIRQRDSRLRKRTCSALLRGHRGNEAFMTLSMAVAWRAAPRASHRTLKGTDSRANMITLLLQGR
jgi:hypothetical protein